MSTPTILLHASESSSVVKVGGNGNVSSTPAAIPAPVAQLPILTSVKRKLDDDVPVSAGAGAGAVAGAGAGAGALKKVSRPAARCGTCAGAHRTGFINCRSLKISARGLGGATTLMGGAAPAVTMPVFSGGGGGGGGGVYTRPSFKSPTATATAPTTSVPVAPSAATTTTPTVSSLISVLSFNNNRDTHQDSGDFYEDRRGYVEGDIHETQDFHVVLAIGPLRARFVFSGRSHQVGNDHHLDDDDDKPAYFHVEPALWSYDAKKTQVILPNTSSFGSYGGSITSYRMIEGHDRWTAAPDSVARSLLVASGIQRFALSSGRVYSASHPSAPRAFSKALAEHLEELFDGHEHGPPSVLFWVSSLFPDTG